MFKEIFESTSAQVYSSVALVIFLTVFFGVTVWVMTRRKKTVAHWSSLPLEDDVAKKGCQGCGGGCCGGKSAKSPTVTLSASGMMPGHLPEVPRGD